MISDQRYELVLVRRNTAHSEAVLGAHQRDQLFGVTRCRDGDGNDMSRMDEGRAS